MIQNIAFYALLVIIYMLVYRMITGNATVTWWSVAVCFGVYLVYNLLNDSEVYTLAAYGLSSLTVFLFPRERFTSRLKNALLVYFISNCLIALWECTVTTISHSDTLISSSASIPIPLVLSLATLILMAVIKRFLFGKQNIEITSIVHSDHVNTIYFGVMLIMVIAMQFAVAGLRVAYNMAPDNVDKKIYFAMIVMSYIAIFSVMMVYIYVSATNNRMKELIQQQLLLNNMQEQYYTELLEKETETRQYRHDINNHLISLKHLVGKGELEKSKDYIASMQEELANISKKDYITGHPLIDMTSTFFLTKVKDACKVKVKGKLSEELPIDLFHLTVIYSNLLQNAVEAVLSDTDEMKEKLLDVRFDCGIDFFQFQIKNTFDANAETRHLVNGDEKKDHGYGLSNVRRSCNALGGNYRFSSDSGLYIAEILIPLQADQKVLEG